MNASEPTTDRSPHARSEEAYSQLGMYLDVYKHHFELFLKGLALYLAIIGGTAAYLYRDNATPESTIGLFTFLALVSVLAVFGCWISRRWVSEIEKTVTRLCDAISLEPFPLFGAKWIVTLVMLGALVVFGLAVFNIWLVA